MQSRRSFLKTAVVASASLPVWQRAALGNQDQHCIDAHSHVWTPDTDRYPIAPDHNRSEMQPASFTAEELLAQARPVGVDRVVLIQMSFYGYDNRYMLDCIRAHPGVFSGVAIIDESSANVDKTMRDLHTQGVRGFRLYADKSKTETWQSSAGMRRMWATAAETRQAMCLLANPDALPAALSMCEKYPETSVVIDHFARIGMNGKVDADELDMLCRFASLKNVYVKTSAFYALGAKSPPYDDLGAMILRLRDAFGAERLMWASDSPYQVQAPHTYAASIALVRDRLKGLSTSEREFLLRKTAEKVFFS